MKIFNGVILKEETVGTGLTDGQYGRTMHIAFGIDANFALGMGVCMTSIILNHPNRPIHFHVFTDRIGEDDLIRLKELQASYSIQISIYYVDVGAFCRFPTTAEWTAATYYRFLMGEYLENKTDSVLYLDADILCLQSLDDLYAEDMDDCIILGVCDFMEIFSSRLKELSINGDRYFNAGVMFIDLKKWSEANISFNAVAMLKENPKKFKSLDQDVLNILLQGKIKFVYKKWDYIYNMGYMDHSPPIDVALLHFAGDKPWQSWAAHHFMTALYEEYKQKSPWKDAALFAPRHYKDKHKMSKSCRKQKKYGAAVSWYFDYLFSRFREK